MKKTLLSLFFLAAGSLLASAEPSESNALGKSLGDDYALELSFIDLKQGRTGVRSDFGKLADAGKLTFLGNYRVVCEWIAKFIDKNWSAAALKKFHVSPNKRYANYIYLPICTPEFAAKCMDAEGDHSAGGYMLYYKGKVRAPKTGQFRFVSLAFDGIYVRFNKKLVLEAGYCAPSLFKDKSMKYSYQSCGIQEEYREKIANYKGHEGYKFYDTGADILGGLVGGNVIKVKEGEEYPIEILVTEFNGKNFGADLYIEDLSNLTRKDGKRTFDLFRTSSELPNLEQLEEETKNQRYFGHRFHLRQFNEDSPIWGK